MNAAPRFSSFTPVPTDADWRTFRIAIPPAEVITVTSLFEACDNASIVRTIDPAKGVLAVWCHASREDDTRGLLEKLAATMPLMIMEVCTGMAYLPEPVANDGR